MLWRALQGVEAGRYIDVGAWDPTIDSVTRAFYERGWRGINVEPNLEKHAALAAERPADHNLACALSDHAGEHVFYDVLDTGLSTLDRDGADQCRRDGWTVVERTVPVTTLAAICSQYVTEQIHFLKVDVEGSEEAVLAGADFSRFRPWIVVVEATEPNSTTPSFANWEPILTIANYRLIYFDGLNRYYAAQEHFTALAPAFLTPPNVFDEFVSDSGTRKALGVERDGAPLPALQGLINRKQAAEAAAEAARADAELHSARVTQLDGAVDRLNQALDAAIAARERSERMTLQAQREAALARADSERRAEPSFHAPKLEPASTTNEAETPTEQTTLYYDATLIIGFGLGTPVGLIRTEHYVAEFLARDTSIDVRFVRFDTALRTFRLLTRAEAMVLEEILFKRYRSDQSAPEISSAPAVSDAPALHLAQGHFSPELPVVRSHWLGVAQGTTDLLSKKMRTAIRLDPDEFDRMIVHYALHFLPVTEEQSMIRRLLTRTIRHVGLRTARAGHGVMHRLHRTRRLVTHVGTRFTKPDAAVEVQQSPDWTRMPAEPDETVPDGFEFPRGSTLLSIGNSWDYLDYTYLNRICRRDQVRFVSVIYDVIAMEFPFATPGPPHLYHRHWVELGHCAAALLAISKFSADQYVKYIAAPNDLSPRLTHAHLPSFLKDRAAEIGETPVASLIGRRFVVYCSTIETRKNHQILLNVWDRLRQIVTAAELPVLVFVGRWGWGTETVRLLAERNYRLRSHLKIMEDLSDAELIWLYRHARFTVFPALSEGYGLAAAESLSFGTPVVIADCPALVEATEELMPALDPLDIVAWSTEILALIRGDSRLAVLRAAAARYRGPAYKDFAEALCHLALGGPADLHENVPASVPALTSHAGG